MKRLAIYPVFVLFLVSCVPTAKFISPKFSKPERVALLPTINHTTDVKGGIVFRNLLYDHSFLPAFAGSNPFKQAYERGVKIIGATSHYVTKKLDEGPIIEQDIIRISHRDTIKELIRKGRDLERLVLARAIRFHAEHRILVDGGKTIIFY